MLSIFFFSLFFCVLHLTVSIPLPLSVHYLGCPYKVAKWNFYWPAWLNNQTFSKLVLSGAVWIHSEKEDLQLVVVYCCIFFSFFLQTFVEDIAKSKVRVSLIAGKGKQTAWVD